ncbi:MAG: hypothetical protein J0L73_19100 [Verrucomicrobia bacterium]|nr:hypothetical protein [Verrucomicrobiota bacterium]
MANEQITPHKITKPIQLLGAWLAGLAIINGSFLAGAATITSVDWIPALLSIAAVLNVPLFLVSLFLLQTKFRPEMQEDTFYAKYLETKYTNPPKDTVQAVDLEKQFRILADQIALKIGTETPNKNERVFELIKDTEITSLEERFAGSRTLSELHLHKGGWAELLEAWRDDVFLAEELAKLSSAGLVELPDDNLNNARLTSIGTEVARRLEAKKKLWNQNHERFMRDIRAIEFERRIKKSSPSTNSTASLLVD